jgi:lipid-A-disaccharide synthase
MKLGILAGEASGDILGAGLIRSLHASISDLHVTGIGGSAMIQAGCQSLYEMERLSVMGYIEPLFRLPELLRIRNGLYSHFMHHRPDVFVGIDSPGFNLGFELKLRRAGIPVVHYVSPSVWAWRKNRIFKIAKAVDLMLTVLPFEEDIYKQHNIPVKFVGHPLADAIPLQSDKIAARKALGVDSDATYIALLPGSRHGELKYLSEIFLATAQLCLKQNPRLKFITSAVNTKRDLEFKEYCKKYASGLPITFFEKRSHDVMAASDVVLVASGTATLETMLFKRPMVVAYRLSPLMYKIASQLVTVSMYSLPNLLAKEVLVPEFIQDAATPDALSAALLDFLNHPEKTEILERKFLTIHQQLRCNANQQGAEAVRKLLRI